MFRIQKIETYILRLLNVESGEETKVKLLLLQSFFIGVFYGVFDITAQSVFLDSFDSEMTSIAIFVSGAMGLLITSLYSRLLRVMKFSILLILNFSFVFVTIMLIRLGYYLSDTKWLSFIVFIMLGPLNLIAIVGFWGMTGRMFTLRQGKRLFGMIDSGQIFGIIISSFAITSFILRLFNNVTIDLLYVSALSIFVALIIQIVISNKFKINSKDTKKERKSKMRQEKSFISLFKSKYVALMALFIVFSMVVAFFILFSFLDVTRDRYPDPVEKTNFISLFTATGMIFSFLFKTFVYSRFINTYGLKAGLLLMPVILGAFALISAGIGTFMGYSLESSGFMIFFLIIVLSRLMSVSLKSSMEVPTFKVLYQSLDIGIRHRIQAGIDGVINEFAALFAGIILLLLGLLDFFEILHYSYFLIFLVLLWIYFTLRLHKEYKKTLENTLNISKTQEINQKEQQQENSEKHEESYLRIIEMVSPLEYENILVNSLEKNCTLEKLEKIKSLDIYSSEKILESFLLQNINEEIETKIKEILDYFNTLTEQSQNEKHIKKLVISIEEDDRIKAATLIGISQDQKYTPNLAVLLRDIVPPVKIAAIRAVARTKTSELCPVLIELLEKPLYYAYAAEALKTIGSPALDSLEQGFFKTGQENQVLVLIIKIIGEIGGAKSELLLINKINIHNKDVLMQTLKSLKKMGYLAPSESDSRNLATVLKLFISITAWNLNIKNHIGKNEFNPALSDAIHEEIITNYDLIFLILSLMHDPNSIDQIKSNIDRGSSESISFAIELLEILLDEEIKPLLFPLLEDVTENEKIRRLQSHFTLSRYTSENLLNAIVNRDSNYISNWVKVCAIESYYYIKNFKPNNSIKAHVFNNNIVLKQSAALLINSLDSSEYTSCIHRLEFKEGRYLKYIVGLSKLNRAHIPFEKIVFLKKNNIIGELHSDILVNIASYMKAYEYPAEEIIFPTVKSKHLPLYMLVSGELIFEEEDGTKYEIKEGQMVLNSLLKYNHRIKLSAKIESTFYKIDVPDLIYLLSKHSSLQNIFINNII